jgi:hypothetical protein
MNENLPPIDVIPSNEAPESLVESLFGMFSEPGEVFERLRDRPLQHINWILPLILLMVLGSIQSIVVTQQPQVIITARQGIEQTFDKAVADGKMTRQQADQQVSMTESFLTPGIMGIFGAIGMMVTMVILFFTEALIIWVLGKYVLGGNAGYLKSLEVVGLSNVVAAVGLPIMTLLVIIYGDPSANPGPMLLLRPFDHHNKLHLIISAFNIFSVWSMIVMGIGVARVNKAASVKGVAVCLVIWVIVVVGLILAFGGR